MPSGRSGTIPNTAPPPLAPPRFDTIDLLRGVSILAVILLHISIRFGIAGFHVTQGLPRWFASFVFRNGGNGVTVFFAISGFLITYTSLQRFGSLAAMRARVFYRIRFARIAPLLLLVLAVLSLLHFLHVDGYVIHKPHASLPGALLSALTFTLNWYEAAHMKSYLPACWTVLWSLSIEEMFYLFFPIACLLLLRSRPNSNRSHPDWSDAASSRHAVEGPPNLFSSTGHGTPLFILLLVALIVTGCFARTVWSHGDGLAQENSYFAGMGDIAVGVLAALLAHRLTSRSQPLAPALLLALQSLGATLILLFAFYPRWHWIHPFMHFTARSGTDDAFLSLATCLVMLASVLRPRRGILLLAPLRWFGRHSYELYLTHEFIVILAVNHFLKLQVTRNPGPLLAWTAAIVFLTAPVAWLLARLFSEPLNRRLRPRQKVAAPQTVHFPGDQVQT